MAVFKLPSRGDHDDGGASYHAWVKIDAENLQQYEYAAERILQAVEKFGFDGANKNPSRLSRLPGALRLSVTAKGTEGSDSSTWTLIHSGRPFCERQGAVLTLKKQPGHKKQSALQEGPLIRKASDLATFADYPQNSEALRKLNKRLKLFRGEDGWFAAGRHGQVWEYGIGKLGFTVKTPQMITIAMEAGFVPKQRGDQEANFSCDWSMGTSSGCRFAEIAGQDVLLLRVQTRSTSIFLEKNGFLWRKRVRLGSGHRKHGFFPARVLRGSG